MRKAWRKILIVSCLTLFGATLQLHARTTWESVRTERASEAKPVIRTSEIEVKTSSGAIFITTNKPVQVKVYSVLGRLISSENLAVGTNRLQLGSHGIFIVKIGDLTCKVAL